MAYKLDCTNMVSSINSTDSQAACDVIEAMKMLEELFFTYNLYLLPKTISVTLSSI